MRVFQKNDILQCINTLKNANKQLRLIRPGMSKELLEQSQQLTIAIGNKIESLEKEGSVTVAYLEELCEILYKAFVCENSAEYRQIIKEMDTSLKKVEKSVREDIQDSPYEIVFMPYKASMWDAMDSVYRSAIKENNCHVVVMPVPYYNMNQKSGQVEVHYEGNLFPEDIPIIDYKMYCIEKTFPDVIFIHNPYDQFNYVTQLPEQYFSSNLIKYTEHLVYIPYFITLGDKVKKDYCVMPAVKNAWRTFVQSDAVRKCYVKYGADSARIVAMGSPKFDMVLRMQEEPPEIPKEWREALGERKIFLLNTHLNPIINKAEKLIDKLHRIFLLFKEQNDAALLWRPHPLSIETAKAMNPQILEQYMKIIDEFKALSNGVYDDTSDVHRAIAISDAYIGDWSSMVTMYGITGKPIFITNINAETNIEEEEESLSFSCAAEIGGYLYVPEDEFNGLFKIDMKTGKSKFVTKFYKEDLQMTFLYQKAIVFHGKIFFIPCRAGHIAEFNTDTKEMKYYKISKDVDECGTIKFNGCIRKDDLLYLFSAQGASIICFNMNNGNIQEHDLVDNNLSNKVENTGLIAFSSVIKVEDYAYASCSLINIFLKIDLKELSCEVISINGMERGAVDIAYQNNVLYFLSNQGDIFSYNLKTKDANLIYKEKKNMQSLPYSKILAWENELWLLASGAEYICKINMQTLKKDEITEYPSGFTILEKPGFPLAKWRSYELKKGNLLFFPRKANMLLSWDNEEKKLSGIKITRPITKKMKYIHLQSECIYNEISQSISYFLNTIIDEEDGCRTFRKEYFKKLQSHIDGACGENIWKYIKQNLNKV